MENNETIKEIDILRDRINQNNEKIKSILSEVDIIFSTMNDWKNFDNKIKEEYLSLKGDSFVFINNQIQHTYESIINILKENEALYLAASILIKSYFIEQENKELDASIKEALEDASRYAGNLTNTNKDNPSKSEQIAVTTIYFKDSFFNND